MMAQRRARLAQAAAMLAPQAALPAGPAAMEIAELQAFPVREPVSRRSYTILRIGTKSGLTGFGECAGASPVDLAHARETLIGRAATAYASVRALHAVGGAVNTALLDILGQSC
ncbi:MAG: hypothetical protein M3Z36_12565, partial [Acidobacteriota bacterium]|nr:hypothetical protein [Acidobacteriota bacterium]